MSAFIKQLPITIITSFFCLLFFCADVCVSIFKLWYILKEKFHSEYVTVFRSL